MDVYVASYFFDGGEDFKFGWIHGGIAWTKSEILINLLESVEGAVKDGEATLNDGAVLEAFNVARMDSVAKMAGFRTDPITGDTLSSHSL